MNNIRLAAFLSGFFLFAGPAFADSPVQFPTGDADWTVDITYTKPAVTPAPIPGGKTVTPSQRKPKHIEITQVGKVKRIRIAWTDGGTSEQWSVPGLPVVFKQSPDGNISTVQNGGAEDRFDAYNEPCDASAFSWVTPACLQSQTPVSYQGKQCLYYLGSVIYPLAAAGKGEKAKREAWIDTKTLLPVVLKTETSLCIFTFQDTPPGPLDPPPKFKDAITYYKHVMGYPPN